MAGHHAPNRASATPAAGNNPAGIDPLEAALSALLAAGLAPAQLDAARAVLRELRAQTFDEAATIADPTRALSVRASLTFPASREERRIATELARRAKSLRPAPVRPAPPAPAPQPTRRGRLKAAITPKPTP